MLKRSVKYILPTFVLLALVILVKRMFNLSGLEIILGGLVGMFLPDLDHLIYIYFLRPQDLTSQRVRQAVSQGQYKASLDLISDTHSERIGLVFHTGLFHVLFFVLSFLVITSSGSNFGRGLVLAALMHLTIDQYLEFKKGRGGESTVYVSGQPTQTEALRPGLHNWFSKQGIVLTRRQEELYFWGMLFLTLVLGLFF